MAGAVIAARYELDDVPIGRGGMGEVWGGYDKRLDRRVAVKFIRFPGGRPDDELTRRFVRESRITARLEHPGVPVVYDAGTHDGDLYLVMQLIRGVAVADLVAEQDQLPVSWAAVIAAQACAVLAVAHARSLVHRDLKPTNLMVCADRTVKVLDFGLAAALEPTDLSRITRTGETLGTPAYMAPEQALSGTTSPQSDLYSLGCVLHEMLTGQAPFAGATPLALLHKHLDQQPRPVRALRPDTPEALERLAQALLAKKPEERPESATEVYRQLLPFATGVSALSGAPAGPAASEPDAVQMYAVIVGRIATSAGEPAPEPGEPSPDPPAPAATRISRDELERARREASDLSRDARFSQAAEVLSDAAERASQALGPADPTVLSLRLELADVLFLGGDYRRAAPAFRALAADLARENGPDDELVLHCRLREATCLAVAGETVTALDHLRALLRDQERVLGGDDERTLELRRQIGLLLLGSGESGQAREVLTDLLSDLLRVLGPEHSNVRAVRDLLANLDRSAGGAPAG